MSKEKSALTRSDASREPMTRLRQMALELDRMFDDAWWASFRLPFMRRPESPIASWAPRIDVFERDNRLVTRVDLPGVRKEDVKVEVADGHLAISGDRKNETETQKENYFRSEREYGGFYRLVPLPEGARVEDVKATFIDGVLQVSVPLAGKPEANVRQVPIESAPQAAKNAA